MGKTTGYHPVSLHVIRGAAEYCGWKFGTITRLKSDVKIQTAEYRIAIVRGPDGCDHWPPKTFRRRLQLCFADEIEVTQVELSTYRLAHAYLKVRLNATPMDEYMEEK